MRDDAPQCKCHAEAMYWHKSPRYRNGGHWECAPAQRARAMRAAKADPEKHRARNREYQRVHKDELNAQRRLKSATDPEWKKKRYEQHRRWAAANHERVLSRNRVRKALQRGAVSDRHTRFQVWKRDGGLCQICGVKLSRKTWHEDHIVPLSKGGTDTLDNVQATCAPCNLRKGDKVA